MTFNNKIFFTTQKRITSKACWISRRKLQWRWTSTVLRVVKGCSRMLSYAMLSGAVVGCASPWDDVGFEIWWVCLGISQFPNGTTQSFLAKLHFFSKYFAMARICSSATTILVYQWEYQLLEHLLGKDCVCNVIENCQVLKRVEKGPGSNWTWVEMASSPQHLPRLEKFISPF